MSSLSAYLLCLSLTTEEREDFVFFSCSPEWLLCLLPLDTRDGEVPMQEMLSLGTTVSWSSSELTPPGMAMLSSSFSAVSSCIESECRREEEECFDFRLLRLARLWRLALLREASISFSLMSGRLVMARSWVVCLERWDDVLDEDFFRVPG